MDWTQIDIKVNVDDVDRAAGIAHMIVPSGIYIEDYSNLEQAAMEIARVDARAGLVDEELLQKDRKHAIIHVYISPKENPVESINFLVARLNAENIKHSVHTDIVKQDDWANNWKQYFKPFEVGEKILICPTWEKAPKLGQRKLLSIDPGMAFGTGDHETTKLMLEMMEKHIKSGQKVLDVGSGSGILSIASLLLGAKSVLGIDIDKLAVSTAVENGKLNNMNAPKYVIKHGDLAKDVDDKYDVVLANIVADAILNLSPDVPRFLNKDGIYIVSGIIDAAKQKVLDKLPKYGFNLIESAQQNGWVCLVGSYKS